MSERGAETTQLLTSEESKLNVRRLCSIALGYATVMLVLGIEIPVFPLEAVKRDASSLTIGVVHCIYRVGQALTGPLTAPINRKFGPRNVHLFGLFLCGFFTALFGVLNKIADYETFVALCLAVRYIQAVGASLVVTSAFILATSHFPEHISVVTMTLESISGVSLALGPALGGFLYDLGGFGTPFYVTGALCFVTVTNALLQVKEVKMDDQSAESLARKVQIYLLTPRGWLLMLLLASIVANWSATTTHLQAYASAEFGFSASLLGLYHMAGYVVFTLSCVLFGRLAGKHSRPYLQVSVCLLGGAVAMVVYQPQLLLDLQPTCWSLLFGHCLKELTIVGAYLPTYGLMLSVCLQRGMEEDLGTQAFVASLWTSVRYTGAGIAPPLAGLVIDATDFSTNVTMVALLDFSLAILTLVWTSTGRLVGCFYGSRQ